MKEKQEDGVGLLWCAKEVVTTEKSASKSQILFILVECAVKIAQPFRKKYAYVNHLVYVLLNREPKKKICLCVHMVSSSYVCTWSYTCPQDYSWSSADSYIMCKRSGDHRKGNVVSHGNFLMLLKSTNPSVFSGATKLSHLAVPSHFSFNTKNGRVREAASRPILCQTLEAPARKVHPSERIKVSMPCFQPENRVSLTDTKLA